MIPLLVVMVLVIAVVVIAVVVLIGMYSSTEDPCAQ